jgi:hypothetical protein
MNGGGKGSAPPSQPSSSFGLPCRRECAGCCAQAVLVRWLERAATSAASAEEFRGSRTGGTERRDRACWDDRVLPQCSRRTSGAQPRRRRGGSHDAGARSRLAGVPRTDDFAEEAQLHAIGELADVVAVPPVVVGEESGWRVTDQTFIRGGRNCVTRQPTHPKWRWRTAYWPRSRLMPDGSWSSPQIDRGGDQVEGSNQLTGAVDVVFSRERGDGS